MSAIRAAGRAAALLLLAALLGAAPSAQAQTTVWEATVTAGAALTSTAGFGYVAEPDWVGDVVGTISDDDFVLDGTTYTVWRLTNDSYTKPFRFNVATGDPPALTRLPTELESELTLEITANAMHEDGPDVLTQLFSDASYDPVDEDTGVGYLDGYHFSFSTFDRDIAPSIDADATFTVKLIRSGGTPPNNAPTVANPIADQTATAGTAFSFAFPDDTFADADAGDTLTYTATLNDSTMLPSWLTFTTATRTFAGTPAAGDTGTITVRVTASDGTDTIHDDFDIVVTAAVVTPPPAQSPNAVWSATVTAGESSRGDTVGYSAAAHPLNETFGSITDNDFDLDGTTYTVWRVTTDTGSTLLNFSVATGDPPAAAQFPSTLLSELTLKATANQGHPDGADVVTRSLSEATYNTSLAQYETFVTGIIPVIMSGDTFTVELIRTPTNTAPTVANPIPDQTATTDTEFTFTVPEDAFADTDTGDTLTYSAALSDASALPSWLTFDPTTRTFTGTPTTAGTLTVRVTATDGSDASIHDDFDIVVSEAFVCTVPELTGRDVHWTATLTAAVNPDNAREIGIEVSSGTPDFGTLSSRTFSIGTTDYTVTDLLQQDSNVIQFRIQPQRLTAEQAAVATLHICDTELAFSSATEIGSAAYLWSITGGPLFSAGNQVTVRLSTPTPPSDNAALSALTLANAADDTNIALTPAFDSATTDYDADAGAAARVTVVPTTDDDNATVAYGDDGGNALTDADGDPANGFQVDIPLIENVIAIIVTAEDGVTTKKYQLTVTRDAAATVSGVAVTSTAPRYREAAGANPRDVYGAGDVIEFTVTFSDTVDVDTANGVPRLVFSLGTGAAAVRTNAPYARGSGTSTLVFAYAVQAGDADSDGIFLLDDTDVTGDGGALQLNGGVLSTGSDGAVSTATTFRAAQADHKVDGGRSGPYVESLAVTSTPLILRTGETEADTYGAGETIEFTLTLSEAVTVTGTPHLQFSLGGTATNADYTRGSGSGTLVFAYAVQAGDADDNGIFVLDGEDVSGSDSAVVVETGESIAATDDSADADLVNPGRGLKSGHKVDGAMSAFDTADPMVLSIVRQDPAVSPTNADSLTWRVTFSEDVANVDNTDFTATGTTAALAVAEVTATTVYDVTASGGDLADLDGTVTLGFASTQNITDTADTPNALTATAPTGTDERSWVLDNTAPTVTITDVPPASDAPFAATFTFSEPVSGFTVGDIAVGNGAASDFTGGDGDTVFTATITPAAAGEVTVDVAANAAEDEAGNGNLAATRATSTYTAPVVTPPNTPATGAPAITGTAQVGETLTAGQGDIADADGLPATFPDDYTFQWIQVDGGTETDIAGATSQTYEPVPEDVGKTLKVKVSFTDGNGNDESLTSDATAAVIAAPTTCAAASLGTRRLVKSFEITVGSATVDGRTIHGVTAGGVGGLVGDVDRASFRIRKNQPSAVGVLAIYTESAPTAGQLTFSLADDVETEQRDALRLHVCGDSTGLAFSTATRTTTTTDVLGHTITNYHYRWSSADLDWSGETTRTVHLSLPANGPATGEPTIATTGTGNLGDELTAATTGIADDDGLPTSFEYQWVREDMDGTNREDIEGETSSTYRLTIDDVGKRVRVRVAFEDLLGSDETLTSAAFPAIGTVAGDPALLNVRVTSTPLQDPDNTGTPDTYGAREHIELTARFNTPVVVASGVPTFTFVIGTTDAVAHYYRGSGTDALVFSYAVRGGNAGDEDTDGITWEANKLAGTIHVEGTTDAPALTHGAQSAEPGHKVDGRDTTNRADTATVTDITVISNPELTTDGLQNTYGAGEDIAIRVTFSEAVTVAGDPKFRFEMGDSGETATDVDADYDPGQSTSTRLVFVYTVQVGDSDDNDIAIGQYSSANRDTFQLEDDDRIRVAANNVDADLGHTRQGNQTGHRVDGTRTAGNVAPTASDRTVTTPADTAYAFTAGDFNFADGNPGDTLASVKITALETAGDLELDGTDVTLNQVIQKADIGAGKLVFTPAAGASGAGYATFMFKVSDGTAESASDYTMTIDVTAADAVGPRVSSIVRHDPSDSPTNADSLTWRVTFSEDVANVDPADFTVAGTTATLAVTEVTASTVFDVTASGGNLADLDGTVTLGFAPGHNIADTATPPNALTAAAPAGTDERGWVLDNTAPALVSAVVGGTTLVLAYDEALDAGSVPAAGDYSVSVAGSAAAPTGVAVSGSQVELTLAAAPAEDAAVTVSYTVPATNPVRDRVGNEAAALSARSVARSLIRLEGGTGEHEGRVEVFHAGAWGTVCDDYWGNKDADVACRMAGYDAGSVENAGQFRRAHFGEGPLEKIWLDNLQCEGHEESLFECRRARSLAIGEHNCKPRENVGVRCLVTGETAPPRVKAMNGISLNAPPGDSWSAGETVEVTLVWSEKVTVSTPAGGEPPKLWIGFSDDEHLDKSGVVRRAVYASGSGTDRTVFAYTLKAGYAPFDSTGAGGDSWRPGLAPAYESVQVYRNSLRLRDGTIVSAGGAAAELAHPGHPPAATQLEAPKVAAEPAVSGPGPDGWWTPGETVEVGLAFDRQVFVAISGGTPSLEIGFLNGRKRRADYRRGTGTHELIFAYTLTQADEAQNAILVTPDSLALGGGRIRGLPDGADAALGHEGAAVLAPPVLGPPPASFTGSFSGAVAEHDGETPFVLGFAFSEAPKEPFSFRTVRNSLFEVSGGAIEWARRKIKGGSVSWNLTVRPSGDEDVTLTVRETGSCDASGAVCTEDGRPLSGSVSVTVPGPAKLSVADAEVDEGTGPLEFTVTLSRARTEATTVDYATADVTATADQDYTETSGTLTFDAGVTERTVSVPVLDDTHDEGTETLTLTLSNPVPAAYVRIADGTATGTISNDDPMPKAWIARFGRTLAEQVLDAVDSRMRAARTPGGEVSLGGHRIGLGRPPGDGADPEAEREAQAEREARRLADWLRGELPGSWSGAGDLEWRGEDTRTLTGRELLLGSSFALTGASEGSTGGTMSLWGRSAVSRFDGREGDLTLDGEVVSGFLGGDWTLGPGPAASTVGLILGHSRGEGGYRAPSGGGTVSSTLTGLYPWGRHALSERVSLWAAAGYGEGALTLTQEGGSAVRTDLDLAMGALGLRGVAAVATETGGPEVAVTADAMGVRTTTAKVDGLAAAEAGVTRLRAGLEAAWPVRFAHGAALIPSVELGVRHDGGDAETGFGADLGGGVAWFDPVRGLSAELRGRGLVSHEATGLRERGLSGAVSWEPDAGGRGPRLSLTQSVGGASRGGMYALLERETLAGLAGSDHGDDLRHRRLEARFGYGLRVIGERFTLTPEAGMGLSDTGRDYTLGWRLVRRSAAADSGSLELSFDVRRLESAGDTRPPEHAAGLRLTSRF